MNKLYVYTCDSSSSVYHYFVFTQSDHLRHWMKMTQCLQFCSLITRETTWVVGWSCNPGANWSSSRCPSRTSSHCACASIRAIAQISIWAAEHRNQFAVKGCAAVFTQIWWIWCRCYWCELPDLPLRYKPMLADHFWPMGPEFDTCILKR